MNESARSRSYPAISLPEAIDALKRQVEGLGSGAHSRGEIAQALGYTSGTSGVAARKISAVAQFGLLSNHHQSLYEPTELALEILAEHEGARLKEQLRTAFLTPALYREIVKEYIPRGCVPRLLALALSDYRIAGNARDEAARVFMDSAVFARVTDSTGVFEQEFLASARLHPRLQGRAESPHEVTSSVLASPNLASPSSEVQLLRLYLTDGKMAELSIPLRLNEQDLAILRMQLNVLETQVQVNRPAAPLRWSPRQERGSGQS